MDSGKPVRRFENFLEQLNNGRLDSIQQNLSKNYYSYRPKEGEKNAGEVYYAILSDLKGAFSNLRFNVPNPQITGGEIRGKLTISGTQDGMLWGAPASGKQVLWDVDIVVRIEQDRFVVALENIAMPEVMGILRQIDLVPPPEDMDKPLKYPVSLPEVLLKVIFTGQIADKPCSHLNGIKVTEPLVDVCQKCVASGDDWPALRMCLTCGYVGCCDTSKNKHMNRHYQESGHTLFRSIRLKESWVWCYVDDAFFTGDILENYRQGG